MSDIGSDIDTATQRQRVREDYHDTISACAAVLDLCDEVDHLRDLLRRALPWIDPNDRHEDYLLTVAIRKALGEGT